MPTDIIVYNCNYHRVNVRLLEGVGVCVDAGVGVWAFETERERCGP